MLQVLYGVLEQQHRDAKFLLFWCVHRVLLEKILSPHPTKEVRKYMFKQSITLESNATNLSLHDTESLWSKTVVQANADLLGSLEGRIKPPTHPPTHNPQPKARIPP